jgi:transcriptional regulator with XRE-family HTH domain
MLIDCARLEAAIKASGKSQKRVAKESGITPEALNRILRGTNPNPRIQTLVRIAAAAKVTVGALLREWEAFGPEDEHQLLQMRQWIDDKLGIDARGEPNAVIVESRAPTLTRQTRVADRARAARIESPFGSGVHLTLRAVGDTMIGAGILAEDMLYAVPQTGSEQPIGSIVACRLGGSIFVKRLVSEHRRLYLVSAHPRYRSIPIQNSDPFEILGVVIGRTGRVG